jgi:hypothetical protein
VISSLFQAFTYRYSAMPSASVYQQRRNQIFSAPSNSVQFLKTSSLIPRLVLLITMIQLSPRILDALTQSSIFPMLRFPACPQTTPATSFFLPAMPVVFSHLFPSSTPPKPCSTSFLVIHQRWLELKMVLRSHRPHSHRVSHNPSWLCTQ